MGTKEENIINKEKEYQDKKASKKKKLTGFKVKMFNKRVELGNKNSAFWNRVLYVFTGKEPSKENKETLVYKFKWFDLLYLGVIVGFLGVFIGIGYLMTVSLDENTEVDPFMDTNLNYSVNIPTYWQQNEDIDMETVEKSITSVTGGLAFDFFKHELKDDVISFSAFVYPEDTKSPVMKKLLTISGNGVSNVSLDNSVKVMSDLKNNLKGIGMEDVKVEYVKDKEYIEGTIGVLAKATAVMENVKINFYQYYLPVGNNVLIYTYGNATKKDGLEDLETVIKSTQLLQPSDGVYYDSIEEGEGYKEDSKDKEDK